VVDIGACSNPYHADILTIGELAALGGVSADTIRYYEREGLLPPPPARGTVIAYTSPESRSGSCSSGELSAWDCDFARSAIDRGLCPCGHAEDLVQRRLAEIDAEITRLARSRTALQHLAERFPAAACPDPQGGPWACEREFIQAGGGES